MSRKFGLNIPANLANNLKANGGLSKVANFVVYNYLQDIPPDHDERYRQVIKYLKVFQVRNTNAIFYVSANLEDVPSTLYKQALLIACFYDDEIFPEIEGLLATAKKQFDGILEQ